MPKAAETLLVISSKDSRKVALDQHDIIIDKVAASYDNNHIVAVTSNNMVCIWRRTEEEAGSD